MSKGSVWFVSRLRVRLDAGETPEMACHRMNRCLGRALAEEYEGDYKGVSVLAIEDPAKILQPSGGHRLSPPVIHGAAKLKY